MASKFSSRDFPIFSTEADTDYLLARLIHFSGSSFQGRAGYFAHQACEKYLKALSVQMDGSYRESHKLLELAKLCEPYGSFFVDTETLRILRQFDVFDQVGRYGAAANYDPVSKGQVSVGDGIVFKPSPDLEIAGARFGADNVCKTSTRLFLRCGHTWTSRRLRMSMDS
jgi:HEPN domain